MTLESNSNDKNRTNLKKKRFPLKSLDSLRPYRPVLMISRLATVKRRNSQLDTNKM